MRKDRRLNFRVTLNEFDYLKEAASKIKSESLSKFIRDMVLDKTGYHSAELASELRLIRWEINKVGTNINQATRRMNSGIGTLEDIEVLLSRQQKIDEMMDELESKVIEYWKNNSKK